MLIAGLSLLIGTVSAMETFCGQAAGAQRHRVLGVVLQRGVASAAVVALPCILVWTQAARILQALGAARPADMWCCMCGADANADMGLSSNMPAISSHGNHEQFSKRSIVHQWKMTIVNQPCANAGLHSKLQYCGMTPVIWSAGQDEVISAMAGRYVILWAPTLLVHGGIEACQRYLISQSARLFTLLTSTGASDTRK